MTDPVPAAQINWRVVLGPKQTFEFDLWRDERWLYYRPPRHLSAFAREELGGRRRFKGSAKMPPQTLRLPLLWNIVEKVRKAHPHIRIDPAVGGILAWYSTHWELPWNFDRLYPFQQEAVQHAALTPYRGVMLYLTPGLGKTPTSIVAAKARSPRRVLVLAPLSLLRNWGAEIQRWNPQAEVVTIHGGTPKGLPLEEDADAGELWVVTNYDTVRTRSDVERSQTGDIVNVTGPWHDVRWDVLILDESVLLKNRRTIRSQVCKYLAKQAGFTLALTGSPITRNTADAWMQLHIIEPEYLPSFWRFAKETCYVEESEWSTEIVGSRPNKSLRELYPELAFVRYEEEVLTDLPQKVYQDMPVQLTERQRKAHDDIALKWLHQLEDNSDEKVRVTAIVAELTRLQQVTSNLRNLGEDWPDESAKSTLIRDLLEAGAVELPLLIWTHWKPGANALFNRLHALTTNSDSALYDRSVRLVHGDVPRKVADDTIEDFKAGQVDVLILGLGVGKYGHTLANVRTVIYHDKSNDSDAYYQSLHRFGGARGKLAGYNHSVRVISLRAPNSGDDIVEASLAGKLPAMANASGADVAQLLRSLGDDYVPPIPEGFNA